MITCAEQTASTLTANQNICGGKSYKKENKTIHLFQERGKVEVQHGATVRPSGRFSNSIEQITRSPVLGWLYPVASSRQKIRPQRLPTNEAARPRIHNTYLAVPMIHHLTTPMHNYAVILAMIFSFLLPHER